MPDAPDLDRARLVVRGEALARAERDLAYVRGWVRSAVVDALGAGVAESEAARLAGVSRTTVRAWRATTGD